jgi:hypothetical protein
MSIQLSHSKISRYMNCPRSYKYHYVDKIKPITHSAALYFGSAMDKALNELLKPEGKETPEQILLAEFSKDNKKTDINIVYANADYDESLLKEEDLLEVASYMSIKYNITLSNDEIIGGYDDLHTSKKQKGFENLTDRQREFFNYLNWLSLYRKGLIILRDYREEILPLLEEVISVQIELNFEFKQGDVLLGFIDFIAKLKDGRVVLFDNKTSSMAYEENSVATSAQLAIYSLALRELKPDLKIDSCGYLVMRKTLKKNTQKVCTVCGYQSTERHTTCNNTKENGKRCGGAWTETFNHRASFQIIVDNIPEKFIKMVEENYMEVSQGIKSNVFPRNLEKCTNWFGGFCPHIAYCQHNSMKGLYKEEEKNEEVKE